MACKKPAAKVTTEDPKAEKSAPASAKTCGTKKSCAKK